MAATGTPCPAGGAKHRGGWGAIPRGRPGPGLLAYVLVSKYAEHLPLYRESQIYAHEDVDVDRSTMANWVGRSAALLEPPTDEIGRVGRPGEALFVDDTPVKMHVPGQKKTKIELCKRLPGSVRLFRIEQRVRG